MEIKKLFHIKQTIFFTNHLPSENGFYAQRMVLGKINFERGISRENFNFIELCMVCLLQGLEAKSLLLNFRVLNEIL